MPTRSARRGKDVGFQLEANIVEHTPKLPVAGWHRLKNEVELCVRWGHSELIIDDFDTVLVPRFHEFKYMRHRVRWSRLQRRRRPVHCSELVGELVDVMVGTNHLLNIVQKHGTVAGSSDGSDVAKIRCQQPRQHATQLTVDGRIDRGLPSQEWPETEPED